MTPEFSRNPSDEVPLEKAEDVFKPYGTEIGHLVFNWNRLHDNLANLFEFIVGSPSKGVATSIWYSTDSDFAQRKMLRAATEKSLHISSRQRESIIWLLNQIDDSLRHKRNDALHSPLAVVTGDYGEGETTWIIPDPGSGSPRAHSLLKSERTHLNLMGELKEYGQLSNTLATYAYAMFRAFVNPTSHAWPDKPKLPHAHRTKSRKESSRRNNDK
jgi:hypothetical protein